MTDQNKLDIELIKKDVNSLTKICEKMDGTIDRMQKVAVDISRIVSLQEQKHAMQDRTNADLEKKIDAGQDSAIRETDAIYKKIEQVESNLSDKIETVSHERKVGYGKLTNRIEDSEAKILAELSTLKENMSKKIYEIDLWRYMVMGAMVLGSFLITKFIDVAKLFR